VRLLALVVVVVLFTQRIFHHQVQAVQVVVVLAVLEQTEALREEVELAVQQILVQAVVLAVLLNILRELVVQVVMVVQVL